MHKYKLVCIGCDESFIEIEGASNPSDASAILISEALKRGWRLYPCGGHCPDCQALYDKSRNYSVKFEGTKLVKVNNEII